MGFQGCFLRFQMGFMVIHGSRPILRFQNNISWFLRFQVVIFMVVGVFGGVFKVPVWFFTVSGRFLWLFNVPVLFLHRFMLVFFL